jgi:hypothetical protein
MIFVRDADYRGEVVEPSAAPEQQAEVDDGAMDWRSRYFTRAERGMQALVFQV